MQILPWIFILICKELTLSSEGNKTEQKDTWEPTFDELVLL